MRTLLPCLALFLAYLVFERLALNRSLRKIPLRIAVTGTRGKSGMVRLLDSILRESGQRVVSKTTGSEAVILLPDGERIELDRSVPPSILEQKRLVRLAARKNASCLVSEVMSIQPENHYVESRHILKPNNVVITNVRADHVEAMGGTVDRIASVLSLVISPGAAVFVPEPEMRESFRAEAARCGATLRTAPAGGSSRLLQLAPELARAEFAEDLDLVCAVASRLGCGEDQVIAGIRKARHDVGRLAMWRYRPGDRGISCYLVNAFAANDPESTFRALVRVAGVLPATGGVIGVLNLRGDRVARTAQWISALKGGAIGRFRQLFVTGEGAGLFRRKLPQAQILEAGGPEEMTTAICAGAADGTVVFGFGNIKGAGRILADHWHRVGIPLSGQ